MESVNAAMLGQAIDDPHVAAALHANSVTDRSTDNNVSHQSVVDVRKVDGRNREVSHL